MFSALIIDADHDAARDIQGVLIPYGFEFTETQDAQEAMSLARTVTPDIIFLRVELPNVSGFSVCNQLRRNDETKYIPLVMYASGVPEDVFNRHRNLKTHADEYLKVPFPSDLLLSAVQNLIPLGEPDDEAGEMLPAANVPTEDAGSAELLEVDVVDMVEVDEIDLDAPEAAPEPAAVVTRMAGRTDASEELGQATDAAFDALVDFDSLPDDDEDDDRNRAETGSRNLNEEVDDPEPAVDPLAGFDPAPVTEFELDLPATEREAPEVAAVVDEPPPTPPEPQRSFSAAVLPVAEAPRDAVDQAAPSGSGESAFKSQREVIALKSQLNAKNREMLGLKDELERQERSVLDAKHKNRELQVQIGELEEKLLRAEEHVINAREAAEAAARDKTVIAKREESLKQRLDFTSRRTQDLEQQVSSLEPLKGALARAENSAAEAAEALRRQAADAEAAQEQQRALLRQAELRAADVARQSEQRAAQLQSQVERLQSDLHQAQQALEAHRDLERRAQQALAVALRVLDGQEATP